MKRVLLVGASSMIGCHLAVALRKHHRVFGTYHRHRPALDGVFSFPLTLQDGGAIRELTRLLKPDVVVYCASETDERRCARDTAAALAVNAEAAEVFAQALKAREGYLIYLSSSKVFSGATGDYRESDGTDGRSIYGQTKIQAEGLLEPHGNALCLRLGSVFGLGQVPARTFFNRFLRELHSGRAVRLIRDEYRSMYAVEEICRLVRLLLAREAPLTGIFHVGQREKHSYYSFGLAVAKAFGRPTEALQAVAGAEFSREPGTATRGADLSLCGDELTRTTGFHPRSVPESLERLRFLLQNGKN